MRVRSLSFCCALAAAVWSASSAVSVDLSYRIIRQPVSAFFVELSAFTGESIVVSDGVSGTIRELTLTGSLEEVIKRVAASARLDTFTFNGVTYVSAKAEATTRLTRLGDLSPEQVIAELETVGLLHEEYPVAIAASGSAVVLSGPPKLLALSEAVIETIPEAEEAPPEPEPQIVIRRGTVRQTVAMDGSIIEDEFRTPEGLPSVSTD